MSNYTEVRPKPYIWSLTPSAPDWRINWADITQFAAIAALKGCPQNPEHHAEGDVLTHTMMVCEALTRLEGWRNLPAEQRSIVFLAALLHDIAKPLCTEQDDEGNISSKEHTRRGASYARFLLWNGMPDEEVPSFFVRHSVDRLVRYSGLPLWLLEKSDPLKAVYRASLAVSMEWLSLLAEADVRGRACKDQSELLERVELFKQYCVENGCFSSHPSFPSNHSRFLYFQTDGASPLREAYDDCRFDVTIMSGLPGAGKDFWVSENMTDTAVISLDQLRDSLGIDAEEDQAKVVAAAREEARKLMRARQSFVWNATNISRFMRSGLIKFFRDYGARLRIVYVEPSSYNELISRNEQRQNPLPEHVLEKLCKRLEVPELIEAHELTYAAQ